MQVPSCQLFFPLTRPVRFSVAAMSAWTVMDPAKEARSVLDVMAQSLLDDPSMPAPASLQTPPADVIRALMSGNIAGQAIGKGNSAEVHACQSNPRFVIRTVREQDEVEWQRELSRLRRVPALSVITTVFATSGRSSLMPRLWPIPRGALRTPEVIRLKYDISAALEMLHRSHIVHADIHAGNLMLRAEPPCFVLIDYSGCTGDSVYPLHLGYGAFGYGGATHRPPTLESAPTPVRTAHGDYYRLANTILKQLHIGPEQSKRKHTDKDSSLPSHLDKELRLWLDRDQWPRPPSPTSPFPPGSWKDSAISPSVILHASLWRANGEIKQDTAVFTSPDSKFGNSNGTLVPEGVAQDGLQGTGSWENSAISARFFLKCQLRTCGRFARTIYQEIFPWQAYSNQDGYLIPANPPPPPPAPPTSAESLTARMKGDGGLAHLTMHSAMAAQTAVAADSLPGIWGAGQAASVSALSAMGAGLLDSVQAGPGDLPMHPVQNAIRTAATSLSAAISLAQDLGQANPSMTHHSLAQSLRVTSEVLRDVSEELMEAARNQPSSAAHAAAPETGVHMECDA